MGLQHAYAVSNLLASLTPVYTWDGGGNTNTAFLSDGRMDKQATFNSFTSAYDGINYKANFKIDLGVSKSVQAIALLNHNFQVTNPFFLGVRVDSSPDNTTWTTRWGTSQSGSLINQTVPRNKEHVFQFGSAVTARYWRFVWCSSNGITYTPAIGEIYVIAAQTTPQRYMVYGYEEAPTYKMSTFESYSGEIRNALFSGPLRRVRILFDDLATSERDDFLTMMDACKGGALPILWTKQYDSTGASYATYDYQDVIWGKFRTPSIQWTEFDFSRYNMQALELWSLGRGIGQ